MRGESLDVARDELAETLEWLMEHLRRDAAAGAKGRIGPGASPRQERHPLPGHLHRDDAERMLMELEAFRGEARVLLAETLRRLLMTIGGGKPVVVNIREEWRATRNRLYTRGATVTTDVLSVLLARYLGLLLR